MEAYDALVGVAGWLATGTADEQAAASKAKLTSTAAILGVLMMTPPCRHELPRTDRDEAGWNAPPVK
jgi:hypothetical protein